MKQHAGTLAIAAITLALVGCSGTTSPTATPSTPQVLPSPTPSATGEDLSLGPVAKDVLLVITAKATTSAGAALNLELRVRTPVPFNDIGGHTVPAAAIASCPDLLSQEIAAKNLWTFTRVNVAAVSQNGTTWPSDQPIALLPSTKNAPIASMSFLGETPGTGMPCQLDKFVPGEGKGAISIGTANDASDQATGGYRRWAQLDYGFVTEGTDVVLSDCVFTLTQGGTDLGGGTSWKSVTDSKNCVTGAENPASVY